MGNRAKADFATLGPVGSGAQRGTQPPFVCADGAFDLPALSVSLAGKALVHNRTVASGRSLCSRPSAQRGDDAVGAEFLTQFAVMGFAVIAGVGQQFAERLSRVRISDGAGELDIVGKRPPVGNS